VTVWGGVERLPLERRRRIRKKPVQGTTKKEGTAGRACAYATIREKEVPNGTLHNKKKHDCVGAQTTLRSLKAMTFRERNWVKSGDVRE